jgi:hypothetical protein
VIGFNSVSQPVCTAGSTGGGGGGGQQDTDADGIPDALDPCPQTPNVTFNAISYCPANVYGISNGTVAPGAEVLISNASVTFVSGTTMTVAILPGDTGYIDANYSTLTLDLGALPPPAIGSRINLYGVVISGMSFAPTAIVVASQFPDVFATLTPQISSVQVGGQVTLTVTTASPVLSDLGISLGVDHRGIVGQLGLDGVIIPAGQSSASFTFQTTDGMPGDTATVVASVGNFAVTARLQFAP